MTILDDRHDGPAELDPFTTERLLLGAIAPDEAPPGYAGVAHLVEAARVPGRPEEVVGVDAAVLSALVALTEQRRDRMSLARRADRARRVVKAKLGALVFAGTLVGTSGLAAAGALPAPLQHVASQALSTVGIHVPDPNHGDVVSNVATTTDLIGREKGQAISEAAKDNHGHEDGRGPDGEHGRSDEPHGKADEPHGANDDPHGKSDDAPASTHEGTDGGGNGQADEPHANEDPGAPPSGPNDATGSPPTDPGAGADGPGGGSSNGQGNGGNDADDDADGSNGNGDGGGPPTDGGPPADEPAGPSGGTRTV